MIRTKAYIIVMSNKDPIKIDEEELERVLQKSEEGGLIVVKQGVVNPSFIVDIQPDTDRINEWLRECSYTVGGDTARERGIKPLKPIYSKETPIYNSLKERMKELESNFKVNKGIEDKSFPHKKLTK